MAALWWNKGKVSWREKHRVCRGHVEGVDHETSLHGLSIKGLHMHSWIY